MAVAEKVAVSLDNLGWEPKDETEKIYYLIAKKKWNELPRLGELAVEPLNEILIAYGEEIPIDIYEGVKRALKKIKAKKS